MCVVNQATMSLQRMPLSLRGSVEIWVESRANLLEWCQHGAEDMVRDQEVDEYHQCENISREKYEKTS